MRQLQKQPTLNESWSTRANVIMIIAGTIAISVWLLIWQKPVQKTEETRSRNQDALEAAWFGKISEEVYGEKTK